MLTILTDSVLFHFDLLQIPCEHIRKITILFILGTKCPQKNPK